MYDITFFENYNPNNKLGRFGNKFRPLPSAPARGVVKLPTAALSSARRTKKKLPRMAGEPCDAIFIFQPSTGKSMSTVNTPFSAPTEQVPPYFSASMRTENSPKPW